jgi:hypothetical protein
MPQLLALEAREAEAETRYWGPELLAQRCGRVFEQLWDAANRASNRPRFLARRVRELLLPELSGDRGHRPGNPRLHLALPIADTPPSETASLPPAAWRAWPELRRQEGWHMTQLEFRHTRFQTDRRWTPLTQRTRFSCPCGRADRRSVQPPRASSWWIGRREFVGRSADDSAAGCAARDAQESNRTACLSPGAV